MKKKKKKGKMKTKEKIVEKRVTRDLCTYEKKIKKL